MALGKVNVGNCDLGFYIISTLTLILHTARAQQRNTDVELNVRSEAARDEEENNQDTIDPLLESTVQSENTAS